MLVDVAIGWVRANCLDPKLRSDLSQKLKDAMQRRVDCWFAVGPVLTRERTAYMIHCFAGELFIFQLTAEQAAAVLPAPHALASSVDQRPPGLNQRANPALLSVSDLQVDRAVLTPLDVVSGS